MWDEVLPFWLALGFCLVLFWSGIARTIFGLLS
jgi:hypothetical protein